MRLAAFQRFPVFDDPAAAAETLWRDLRWAEARGVDLALFPECYLVGYAHDRRTVERRAVTLDGAVIRTLLSRLAPIAVTAVIGLFERRADGVYNSAIVVEAGRIIGSYAKAYPNEKGVMAGRDFPIFTRSDLRFGVNICNDANHPDAAQRLADQGARLVCLPLNNMLEPEIAHRWRGKSVENLQARARQTGCWVAAADVTGRAGDAVSYGCTAIVRPDGEIAARALELAEDVVVFDIA